VVQGRARRRTLQPQVWQGRSCAPHFRTRMGSTRRHRGGHEGDAAEHHGPCPLTCRRRVCRSGRGRGCACASAHRRDIDRRWGPPRRGRGWGGGSAAVPTMPMALTVGFVHRPIMPPRTCQCQCVHTRTHAQAQAQTQAQIQTHTHRQRHADTHTDRGGRMACVCMCAHGVHACALVYDGSYVPRRPLSLRVHMSPSPSPSLSVCLSVCAWGVAWVDAYLRRLQWLPERVTNMQKRPLASGAPVPSPSSSSSSPSPSLPSSSSSSSSSLSSSSSWLASRLALWGNAALATP
jgi:hypothetical protein